MDTAPTRNDSILAAHFEGAAELHRRLAWEAELIAKADAEIAAGLFVDSGEVEAWIDSIGTDHELPVPHPRP